MTVLELRGLCGRPNLGPLTLCVQAGERIAVLGPSGAGKSSLLRLLVGEWMPTRGELLLRGRKGHQTAQTARLRALLPQQHRVAFGLPVPLVVGLGRLAQEWAGEGERSRHAIVQAALLAARAGHLAARNFDELSGGEQARVMLARVLAQLWDAEEGVLLVDEPLAALDPGLQLELAGTLVDFAQQRRHALIAVLHDINLALQHFEQLWLMAPGGRLQACAADAAAVPALQRLFGLRLQAVHDAEGRLAVLARAPLSAMTGVVV